MTVRALATLVLATACALRAPVAPLPVAARDLPPLLDDLDLASLETAIERTVLVW